MESGINNVSPLLTIAIPTWNRASTIDKALEFLLDQVDEFKQYIEVVISNNASEDNTDEIINAHMNNYPNITYIYNVNEVNIGFFGNFKKCRELATGKYLWILSDDDFVCAHVIHEIIDTLTKGNEYSTIFLKNDFKLNFFEKYELSCEKLLEKETYNIGLISSVIFLNEKMNDKFLFDRYYESPFIGFIFLLNSFVYQKNTLILHGKCLLAANHKSSVSDFFDVFINGMEQVIDYMYFMKFSNKIIKHFRNKYLCDFIRPSYILYKTEKEIHFSSREITPIEIIEERIKGKYSDLLYYWFSFFPFVLIPKIFLIVGLKFHRFLKSNSNVAK
jgi:glycosyltransferase involved in cell wall biosynthesis